MTTLHLYLCCMIHGSVTLPNGTLPLREMTATPAFPDDRHVGDTGDDTCGVLEILTS